jgi:hypothetical protein
MGNSKLQNISFIGVAGEVSNIYSLLNCGVEEELPEIIGFCPLFSELTWYVLLNGFRKRENCKRQEALPAHFEEGINLKKDLLAVIPVELRSDDHSPRQEDELNGWPEIFKIARGEITDLQDDWRTVRATVHVIKMADVLMHHFPDRGIEIRKPPFDIATAYYRGINKPALLK